MQFASKSFLSRFLNGGATVGRNDTAISGRFFPHRSNGGTTFNFGNDVTEPCPNKAANSVPSTRGRVNRKIEIEFAPFRRFCPL